MREPEAHSWDVSFDVSKERKEYSVDQVRSSVQKVGNVDPVWPSKLSIIVVSRECHRGTGSALNL